MSRQVDVRENFYLVGYATTVEITPIIYNGLQILGTVLGALQIDGVVPSVAELVLVKDQTNKIENGIYRVINNGTGVGVFQLDRVSDTFGFDKGKPIYVINGVDNYETSWILTHPDEYIVVGVTLVSFLIISKIIIPPPPPPVISKKIYTLSANKTVANTTNWVAIGEFQWNNAIYNTYTGGTILTGVTISGSKNINIRLIDVTNNITLGQILNVSVSGPITFPVINPSGDAVLQIQISRTNGGGMSPCMHGVVLEYTTIV